ncbi:MAG: hypothetical protein KC940_03025, partial [Candidatus Omnitrophica bacterium]|nr:hypothetical protein [Candidatus Omnitrophota bacterium]
MNPKEIGTIIAERQFTLSDNPDRIITARMGMPKVFSDNGDYCCPIQVLGAGNDRVLEVGGVDAVQAIDLALKALGARLWSMQKESGGKIVWLDEGNWDLGLPMINMNQIEVSPA